MYTALQVIKLIFHLCKAHAVLDAGNGVFCFFEKIFVFVTKPPDFIKNPTYTKEGFPLVTQMQNQCKYYVGNKNSESCHGCRYLQIIEDLFGICTCPYNKQKKEDEVYE